MDALRKLVCLAAGLVVIMATTILTMICGWGLQPKSWLWIIVLNFVGACLGQMFVELAKDRR